MFNSYIIDVGSRAAGLVVRNGSAFRFFAATHEFRSLEGAEFRTVRAAEAAAKELTHLRNNKRVVSTEIAA
jgi:hypothetical protein